MKLHLSFKNIALIYSSSIKCGFALRESPILSDTFVPFPMSLYGPSLPCKYPHLLPVLFSPHSPSALPFSFDVKCTVLTLLSPGHQCGVGLRSHPWSAVLTQRSKVAWVVFCMDVFFEKFSLIYFVRTTAPGVHFSVGRSSPACTQKALGNAPGPSQGFTGAVVIVPRHWVPVAFTHGSAYLHGHGTYLSPSFFFKREQLFLKQR